MATTARFQLHPNVNCSAEEKKRGLESSKIERTGKIDHIHIHSSILQQCFDRNVAVHVDVVGLSRKTDVWAYGRILEDPLDAFSVRITEGWWGYSKRRTVSYGP